MSSYPCKVWSGDRTIRKTFMTFAKVDSTISEARKYGLQGSKLVLECDGSEICGDPVFEYYLRTNSIFLLLQHNEWWSEKTNYTSAIEKHKTTMKHYSCASDESENFTNEDIKPFELTLEDPILSENTTFQSTHLHEYTITKNKSVQPKNSPYSVDLEEDETSMFETRGNLLDQTELTDLLFENFKIPWDKIPADIMDLLNSQKKLAKRLNAFCNIIVDALRVFSFYIPIRILRSVAQKVVSRYPHSFLEIDNQGNIVSKSTVPLLAMMRNRNNFLNRSLNNKPSKSTTDADAKDQKRRQPKEKTAHKHNLTSEQKQGYLKSLHGTKTSFTEMEIIKAYMKDCFSAQRKYINSIPAPDIENVKQEWPYIFEREYLYQYFSDLMEFDSYTFLNNFKSNQEKLVRFFKNNTWRAKEGISEEKSIIFAIFKYFGEDASYLFKHFKMGTSFEEVSRQIPTSSPFLALVKSDDGRQKEAAYIFIQETLVAEFVEGDFLLLLIDVINYYFVFNVMYPKQISQSMEFFVRFFYRRNSSCIRVDTDDIDFLKNVNILLSEITNFE